MSRHALSIPEPPGEVAGGGPQPEPLESWQYLCSQCQKVGRIDDLLPFQIMLGTCDGDPCLERRVAELLQCERKVRKERG